MVNSHFDPASASTSLPIGASATSPPNKRLLQKRTGRAIATSSFFTSSSEQDCDSDKHQPARQHPQTAGNWANADMFAPFFADEEQQGEKQTVRNAQGEVRLPNNEERKRGGQ